MVNIASDVRWGRVEETYGEDPYLASAMARAYVGTFERAGIVTTPKHLVANVGEGGRDSYPIELSQRALEERFFPPFRSAIQDAGARSVMSAYNSVDGSPATQNRALLTDVLRTGWGFTGFVISDAAATGGLSYTSFAYSDLRIEKVDGDAAIAARVHCTVRNSGARAGDEVAQLYLHDVLATVVRPMSELAGFARLRLAPGESRTIAFPIRRAQLELLNANMTRVLEPGTWRVMVGASSRDIRLRGEFAM